MGPEIYSRFIAAAGGPDALIIDVPTAGGDSVYGQNAPGTRGWRLAGAKNIYVLHTKDKKLADSDSFAAILKKAGGVWFEGGRQFHLVNSYAGTKTEQGFHDVLARGGVVGGSSAGASIIGDFLVRGAPSNDNFIMDHPEYEKGFAFLRNTGIDQHVVARERLADLADSIMPKYPDLLGISEDEGTAWIVKGDTGTIVGRNKAFVYGGKDETDPRKPFLTLYPGDTYNLATRRVMKRASDGSPVTARFIDSLFNKYSNQSLGGATVLGRAERVGAGRPVVRNCRTRTSTCRRRRCRSSTSAASLKSSTRCARRSLSRRPAGAGEARRRTALGAAAAVPPIRARHFRAASRGECRRRSGCTRRPRRPMASCSRTSTNCIASRSGSRTRAPTCAIQRAWPASMSPRIGSRIRFAVSRA
jgi:cyanophycinase